MIVWSFISISADFSFLFICHSAVLIQDKLIPPWIYSQKSIVTMCTITGRVVLVSLYVTFREHVGCVVLSFGIEVHWRRLMFLLRVKPNLLIYLFYTSANFWHVPVICRAITGSFTTASKCVKSPPPWLRKKKRKSRFVGHKKQKG